MNGKICMITGANSGIGKATALGLAEMDATVIMVCRNQKWGKDAREEIREKTGNQSVDLLIADLSSQKAMIQLVADFKSKYQNLHVLINNAGVLLQNRSVTIDGIETTFAVNFLAPFLLTHLLLDTIKASAPARIINVSSATHTWSHLNLDDLQNENRYDAWTAYSQSKLALILFTYELAKRLKHTNVTVNCLHPGVIDTNIGSTTHVEHQISSKSFNKLRRGAETSIFLATSPDVENVTGKYFIRKKVAKSSTESYDEVIAQKLWDISVELTQLDSH
ncbi:SDR family oxidoreductase [Candidatus Borrarchaeum sp.]|uniref:SDR family oxidoreductase n=1 Tax=Candidatus Borrarchaeum sp. TaxID=2846742 RepID=UPI002579AF7E|nr:SDR family oxidoreductase [Candidatus Borrarchaeum sp.]